MSKSRAKKLRKRARKNESGGTNEVLATATNDDDGLTSTCWYSVEGEERTQNLYALKVEILGPFLFSRSSLCEKAVQHARDVKILPIGSQTWPMFFRKEKWEQIHLLVQVTMETINLCEKDRTFCEQLMTAPVKKEKLCKMVQTRSEKLSCYSSSDLQPFFTILTIHVADFADRVKHCSPGQLLIRNNLDQDELIAPVKDRGNSNFKQHRYRAAIADYTTAIKLCPYSAVLYCNRALCYLRNDEHWCSCLDSYRALILKPSWEKPYYRCAEAWLKLGDANKALIINELGRLACSETSDLSRQYGELQMDLSKSAPTSPAINSSHQNPLKSEDKLSIAAETDNLKKKDNSSTDDIVAVETDKKIKKAHHLKSSKISRDKKKKTKLSNPFTNFETLHCPQVSGEISCKYLRQLCNQVKLCSYTQTSYFAQSEAWEKLEPDWSPPRIPVTDPCLAQKPLSVTFNEIWCPILSDMDESKHIKPPKFHYLAQMKFGDEK